MNHGCRFLFATALLCVATFGNAADLVPRATKKLDAYLDLLHQQGLVSGSVAIAERGAVRYRRSIGFATIDAGVPQPADEGTRYRIGPVSRLFTATMMVQLAESATITLDNKLAEFYPDAPDALTTSYRDLLSERGDASEGADYLLLAGVLEKVDEHAYDDILRRKIAKRLGLVRTYVAGSGTASSLESISYEWHDGWKPVSVDPMTPTSEAIVSNAGDLIALMNALFGARIVTSYSVGNMVDQGIGLRRLELAGMTCVGARGHIAAFETFVCHFPDEHVSIAWTSNATRLPVDEVLGEILRLVFEKGRKPPKSVTAR